VSAAGTALQDQPPGPGSLHKLSLGSAGGDRARKAVQIGTESRYNRWTLERTEENALALRIDTHQARIVAFCRQHYIRRLALFGSVLREDFRPESDVDVLVEFEPGHVPGLIRIARLERELSEAFGGRKVDLRTAEDLSRYFRAEVLAEAEALYEE